jgi:hypothetical protein
MAGLVTKKRQPALLLRPTLTASPRRQPGLPRYPDFPDWSAEQLPWATPASRKSRESFAAPKTETGWLGPCFPAERAWNGISTDQLLEELHQIQRICGIHSGATKAPTALLPCSRNRPSRTKLAKIPGLDQAELAGL